MKGDEDTYHHRELGDIKPNDLISFAYQITGGMVSDFQSFLCLVEVFPAAVSSSIWYPFFIHCFLVPMYIGVLVQFKDCPS